MALVIGADIAIGAVTGESRHAYAGAAEVSLGACVEVVATGTSEFGVDATRGGGARVLSALVAIVAVERLSAWNAFTSLAGIPDGAEVTVVA